MWMLWVWEEGGSDDWHMLLVGLALLALIFSGSYILWSRKRKRIDAWHASFGFRKADALPVELRPESSAWRAETTVQLIMRGECNGFPCVMFEATSGSESGWWTVIAVKRDWREGAFTARLEKLGAKLDRTSAPEWLMAKIAGNDVLPSKLEPLLLAMTDSGARQPEPKYTQR